MGEVLLTSRSIASALGKTSPSMDKETEITENEISKEINIERIKNAAKDFVGEIEQVPPMYSAIKINGKRLYKLARNGVEIERPARKVKINSFLIKNIKIPDIEFEVNCSKGTYIRVLADDMGKKLNCGGILSELRRTAIGEFNIEKSLKVEDFVNKVKKNKDYSLQ